MSKRTPAVKRYVVREKSQALCPLQNIKLLVLQLSHRESTIWKIYNYVGVFQAVKQLR